MGSGQSACQDTIAHDGTCSLSCNTGYTISGEQPRCDNGVIIGGITCIQDIHCDGSWGPCNSNCRKTYTIHTEQSGSGNPCPNVNNQVVVCEPPVDDCKLPDGQQCNNNNECINNDCDYINWLGCDNECCTAGNSGGGPTHDNGDCLFATCCGPYKKCY